MARARLFAVLIMLAAAASWPSCECSGAQAQGEPASVGASLLRFLDALAGGDGDHMARALGWNASADPCGWGGVGCDDFRHVYAVSLEGLRFRGFPDLNGTVDVDVLCAAVPTLRVVNLYANNLQGELPASIASCAELTVLSLAGNRLSGSLPASLSQLRELHTLDVSWNDFSGEIPGDLTKLNLKSFLVNHNRLSGIIPDFDLTGFAHFNVSSNFLTGPIPRRIGRFRANSFLPKAPGLCGQPLLAPCLLSPAPQSSAYSDEN